MSQEHAHTLNWHAGEKQFHCERVAQSVRMTVWNLRDLKEAAQARLPAACDAIELALPLQKKCLSVTRGIASSDFRTKSGTTTLTGSPGFCM
ncbi:MAG TPA: hypothetical protein VJN89_10460 [Candidatus Acidoferrum sp.]|nr:hypothetical protein [Candidatus Acidoferrum sp.]